MSVALSDPPRPARARARRLPMLVAVLALAVAGCGESPEDTAHDNGEEVGEALRSVADARSAEALQSAVTELKDAVGGVSDDVSDRVRQQVSVQRDSLTTAVDGLRQTLTSGDPGAADQARTELQDDVQQLRSQASSFASTNDSVTNAFWDGVKDGYDDD